MKRASILSLILLTSAHAAAQQGELAESFERAEALDATTDYAAAASAYESYAEACLASATAVLDAQRPCERTDRALARAFELRRALGDAERADADAEAFTAHFLYARPRRAMRIAYDLAEMHLEGERPRRALLALDRFEGLLPDPPPGLAIVADGMRARVAMELGRTRRAHQLWRRVERRWEHARAELDEDGAVPVAWVRATVAEGRLSRAEANVERFLATRAPRAGRIDDDARWWSRTMSPWLVRTRRRLLLARVELESVYELGSPRHSVIAAARIGEMYGHQASLHAELTLPESEWLRALVNDGSDRPGYDEARAHLETCVEWASHHGVASEWAERCEEDLHGLDPDRYPLAAELHGQASYHPVSHALPAATYPR
ncbi:MAG: hypothetical protein SangKO_025580 [Sandaracinaceae bacterium]